MRLLIGLAAACVFVPGVAQAKDENTNPAEKVICKRVYEPDTGSHMQTRKRACHTAAEWKAIQEDTQRALREMSDRGLGGTLSPSGAGAGRPQ